MNPFMVRELDVNGLSYREVNGWLRQCERNGVQHVTLRNVQGQRYIGTGLSNRMRIDIEGTPGNDLGAFMNGCSISVYGNAQDAVGNTMNAGHIVVHGQAGDVVGHSANKPSVLRAVEAVDTALGRIVRECLLRNVACVITSDHGTVEEWLYPDGKINTGHTKNKVPFIVVDGYEEGRCGPRLRQGGELADVAPTLLELLEIPKPDEMTGRSLLVDFNRRGGRKRRLLLLVLDGWGIREEDYGNLIRFL